MKCHCDSGKNFDECCQPFLDGKDTPKTALQLMRSRYSAHITKNAFYILNTEMPQNDEIFAQIMAFMNTVNFTSLKVTNHVMGSETDNVGMVEYHLKYVDGKEKKEHTEQGNFIKVSGKWFFVGEE